MTEKRMYIYALSPDFDAQRTEKSGRVMAYSHARRTRRKNRFIPAAIR